MHCRAIVPAIGSQAGRKNEPHHEESTLLLRTRACWMLGIKKTQQTTRVSPSRIYIELPQKPWGLCIFVVVAIVRDKECTPDVIPRVRLLVLQSHFGGKPL